MFVSHGLIEIGRLCQAPRFGQKTRGERHGRQFHVFHTAEHVRLTRDLAQVRFQANLNRRVGSPLNSQELAAK